MSAIRTAEWPGVYPVLVRSNREAYAVDFGRDQETGAADLIRINGQHVSINGEAEIGADGIVFKRKRDDPNSLVIADLSVPKAEEADS